VTRALTGGFNAED